MRKDEEVAGGPGVGVAGLKRRLGRSVLCTFGGRGQNLIEASAAKIANNNSCGGIMRLGERGRERVATKSPAVPTAVGLLAASRFASS